MTQAEHAAHFQNTFFSMKITEKLITIEFKKLRSAIQK